jgi:hypothetical protein
VLLYEKNEGKAAQIREKFEKNAAKYPYPNEIESERELMEYAERLGKVEESGNEKRDKTKM